MARTWTMLAATRNLSTKDLATAKWVGADQTPPPENALSGLNSSQGQAVFADGSARQTNDSDIGPEGRVTKAHQKDHQSSSSGVSIGSASTVVIGCCGGEEAIEYGLWATYFSGRNWGGQSASRVDKTLHLPFGCDVSGGHPPRGPNRGHSPKPHDVPGNFGMWSAKWIGKIKADKSEPHTFYINADNEAWLFINGREVHYRETSDNRWDSYTASKPLMMTAGAWVEIEVRYKEWHRPETCHLIIDWSSPATKRGKIPEKNFRLPPKDERN